MIRLALLIGCTALLWLFGPRVHAQPAAEVTVRSGDHAGYSRLVFDLPGRLGYTLGGSGRARDLRLDRGGWRFDTGTVFTRMSRERLTRLTPLAEGRGMRLALDCACEVEAFWHGRAMLVVDIRDPAPPEVTAPEEAAAKDPRPSRKGAMTAPRAAPGRGSGTAASMTASTLAPLLPQRADLSPAADDPETAPGAAGPATDLAPARAELARQIARAATLGLLTPADTGGAEAEAARDDPATPEKAGPPPAADMADTGRNTAEPVHQLLAQTAMDRDVAGRRAQNLHTERGTPCLPDTALAIDTWGDGSGYAAQIGPARARLMEEFDRTAPESALHLARLYLYFGSGPEAQGVARMAGLAGRDAAIIDALGDIFEYGHAADTLIARQMTCETHAALWSALSQEALPADAALDADSMLRSAQMLPEHLRRILLPGLARKFTAAGQPGTADRFLRILERGGARPEPGQGLARAEVDLAGGALAEAETGLGDVVAANAEASAEALVLQIDTRLRTGRGVPTEMAELAGAYAHELRDTPIGHDVVRVYLEATAAAGDFDGAFERRARLRPGLPADVLGHTGNTLMALLTRDAEDVGFIRHALGHRAELAEQLAPETGNAVARRMLDLGFAGAALAYLRPASDGRALRDRRILRARAALALDRPRQAQVDLLGLVGEEVNVLRAQAQSMVGAHRAAQLLYTAGGQTQDALRAAMAAEDWTLAAALGDDDIAALDLLAQTAPDPALVENALAANRALLESSAETRRRIDGLLGARTVPDAATE